MSTTSIESETTKTHKVYKVLSLDGGGIRGVAVARILEEIEKKLDKPIHKLFDMVIGTSTGGILTVLMTVPKEAKEGEEKKIASAEEAKKFYFEHGERIFAQPTWRRMFQLFTTKHSEEGLLETIDEIYGLNANLSQAKIHAAVVATDKSNNESVVLNSWRAKKYKDTEWRHNARLQSIVRATSAAPSYFPEVELRDYCANHNHPLSKGRMLQTLERAIKSLAHKKDRKRESSPHWNSPDEPTYHRKKITLEDGGCSNNNPAWLGLDLIKSIAREECESLENVEFKFVSIGTGTLTGKEEDPSHNPELYKGFGLGTGLLGVGKRLCWNDPFFINAKSYETHEMMEREFEYIAKPDNYLRVQFKVTAPQLAEMDNPQESNLLKLVDAADEFIYADIKNKILSDDFTDVLKLINPDYGKSKAEVSQPQQEVNDAPQYAKVQSTAGVLPGTATSLTAEV